MYYIYKNKNIKNCKKYMEHMNRGLMFRMYTKFLEIEKKKINNLIENWSKDFNWQLTEKI